MARKKWNRLTDKGKDDLKKAIFDLQINLTDLEDNYDKVYDYEETINDNIKGLIECDQDCTTCTERDRAACLLNFRKANIFFLGKLRSYETFFSDAIQYIIKFIQGMHQIFVEGKDPEEVEKEQAKNDKEAPDIPVSMFS